MARGFTESRNRTINYDGADRAPGRLGEFTDWLRLTESGLKLRREHGPAIHVQ